MHPRDKTVEALMVSPSAWSVQPGQIRTGVHQTERLAMSITATTSSVRVRRALLRSAVGGLTAAAVGLAGSPVALADDSSSATDVTAAETLAALEDTTGVLTDSDRVSARSDSDSAAVTSVVGSSVDIPRDLEDGVSLTNSDGTGFTVTPPQDGDTEGTRIA